jgi:hypothetical protein
MSKPQLGLYKEVAEKLRAAIFEGTEITNVLTKLAKLQQITSGFLMHEDEVQYLKSGNPKLTRLRGILDEGTDKVIIWIKFKAEAALLRRKPQALCTMLVPQAQTIGKQPSIAFRTTLHVNIL